MRLLAKELGVDLSRAVAIGDAPNDVDMLEAVGFGVAVEGALPEVLIHAACTCPVARRGRGRRPHRPRSGPRLDGWLSGEALQDRGKTLITGLRGAGLIGRDVRARACCIPAPRARGVHLEGAGRVRSSPARTGASPAAARGLPRSAGGVSWSAWQSRARAAPRPQTGPSPELRCCSGCSWSGARPPSGWRSASSSGSACGRTAWRSRSRRE